MSRRLSRFALVASLCFWLAGCATVQGTWPGVETPSEDRPRSSVTAKELATQLRDAETRQRSGDLEGALLVAERVARQAEEQDDARSTAAAETVIAGVLIAMGETDRARERLEIAIAKASEADLRGIEAVARLKLGHVERASNAPDRALVEYETAATLAAGTSDHALVARAATSALRAIVRMDQDPAIRSRARDAVPNAAQAIARVESGETRASLALHAVRSVLIAIESDRGDRELLAAAARELVSSGLESAEQAGDVALAAELLGERGRLAWVDGRIDDAVAWTDAALLRSQQAGSEVNRIRWHLQAGSLRRIEAELDAALVHYAAAVELAQRHRAGLVRSFAPGVPVASDTETGRIQNRIRGIYLGYVDLLLERARLAVEDSQAQADLSLARDTLESFKANELRDYFADECVDRYRERITTVDAIGAGTLVIYPVVLPDRLALLVSGREGIEQRTVAVAEPELRATVENFRERLVRRTTSQYRRSALRLYEWLIRPVEDLLEREGIHTIVFVPDSVLRTIPLAALHDGEGFLVERFAIATAPGIELTDPRPVAGLEMEVLLGGLSQATQGFDALPNVVEELSAIQDRVGGKILLNEDFREARVTEEIRDRDFDLVHLATHASFDRDSSTGFLLTYDGRLGLDEFADTLAGDRFRKKPLELLVLSACETAAGDERAALGLSGIAIKAGARSAIGSLWKVSDEAAAQLLIRFYDALSVAGTSRAEALRIAQISLIEERRFRHPAYWSAFLLLNSWL